MAALLLDVKYTFQVERRNKDNVAFSDEVLPFNSRRDNPTPWTSRYISAAVIMSHVHL